MTSTIEHWQGLVTLVTEIENELGKVLQREAGLAISEYRALTFLAAAPKRELRMQDLAARLHMSQSSVSRMVERLARDGHAMRDTCPDDKRGIYAVLTDGGHARLETLTPQFNRALEHLIEQRGVRDLLKAVEQLISTPSNPA